MPACLSIAHSGRRQHRPKSRPGYTAALGPKRRNVQLKAARAAKARRQQQVRDAEEENQENIPELQVIGRWITGHWNPTATQQAGKQLVGAQSHGMDAGAPNIRGYVVLQQVEYLLVLGPAFISCLTEMDGICRRDPL